MPIPFTEIIARAVYAPPFTVRRRCVSLLRPITVKFPPGVISKSLSSCHLVSPHDYKILLDIWSCILYHLSTTKSEVMCVVSKDRSSS